MSLSKLEADSRSHAAVLRYLRCGVRSSHEVLTYLRDRGVATAAAQQLVARYRAQGLLDDRAAARLWAEHWARDGYASEAIRQKLSAKGFHDSLITDITNRVVPAADDEPRAREWLSRRAPRATGPQRRVQLARRLASRGFDPDLIERLLHPTDPVHSDVD